MKEESSTPQSFLDGNKYRAIVIGAGITGAAVARVLANYQMNVLVIEKRSECAGNCHDTKFDNYYIHDHGPHIFHTSDKFVWDFVNNFATFNNFINCPLVLGADDEIYNLPFNMNLFCKFFNTSDPKEAKELIEADIEDSCNFYNINRKNPKNLWEQAISLVGRKIFYNFIKDYTEKQWGQDCKNLDASIIKRLPLRYTFNNNYFNDRYQGVPTEGYTNMIQNMLRDDYIDVIYNMDALDHKDSLIEYSRTRQIPLIYTGPIDQWFDYKYGMLGWRTLKFKTFERDVPNYMGNAVKNFATWAYLPTRCIEHKHFTCLDEESIYASNRSMVTYEHSDKWEPGKECYYPLNSKEDKETYKKYKDEVDSIQHFYTIGRLANYQYKDMAPSIKDAQNLAHQIISHYYTESHH